MKSEQEKLEFCQRLKALYEWAAKRVQCEKRRRLYKQRARQYELMIERLTAEK